MVTASTIPDPARSFTQRLASLPLLLIVALTSEVAASAAHNKVSAATNGQQDADNGTTITLSYSEVPPSSETNVGDGIIGHIEAIFAGEREAPLHAFHRVSVAATIHVSDTEPWRVTLALSSLEQHIGDQIEQKANLIAEADFMLEMLRTWSVELNDAQVQELNQGQFINLDIIGPLDVLQTWDGPRSISVRVQSGVVEPKVKRVRFVRKDGEFYNQIHVVLYHELFFIEVHFETAPSESQLHVELEPTGGQRRAIAVKRTSENDTVFRSDAIVLTPPSANQTGR